MIALDKLSQLAWELGVAEGVARWVKCACGDSFFSASKEC